MLNDREKLIDALENIGIYEVTMNAELIIDHLIANGVTVRTKGEWERITYGWVNFYYCPFCDTARAFDDWNFCPNCGADMRGDSE